MKLNKISRRGFILSTLLLAPCAVVADAGWIEPTDLKIRRLRIGDGGPTCRLVHFTDLHFKGDRAYAESVVRAINSESPDFICFTGDIVERSEFLPEVLEILSGIKSPMFGVPGNHDFWSRVSFEPIRKCFASTGGAWMVEEKREIAGGKINLIGIALDWSDRAATMLNPQAKNILLMHYPACVKKLGSGKFDLILAGHSHGGQVRIPFYGPVVVPSHVDEYDLGLFQTKAGPLYVNPGIGYLHNFEFRFNCRPEITVIEV
jgi:uncharacterized protein